MKKITIIGCGNLGSSIAEGLLNSRFCNATDLTITKRNIEHLDHFARQGVNVMKNNKEATRKSDVIILAVKPFHSAEVLQEISSELTKNKILVSVVTGVAINEISCRLTDQIPIIRAMPNTAIAIGESMTCISSINANQTDIDFIKQMFSTVGRVVEVEEKLMDASTVLAACGTAFAMRYIRACIQGGIEIGFNAELAKLIAAQTVKGAAQLLLEKRTHPEFEIDKVTTPKGCTIAGLNEMEHQGFSSSLIKGICASFERIH